MFSLWLLSLHLSIIHPSLIWRSIFDRRIVKGKSLWSHPTKPSAPGRRIAFGNMPSGCCLLMKVKSLEWDEQNSDRNDAIGSVQNFLDSFEFTQRKFSFNYLASCASTCSLQCCFFFAKVWGLEVPVLFHVIELAHGFWAILVFALSPEHPASLRQQLPLAGQQADVVSYNAGISSCDPC